MAAVVPDSVRFHDTETVRVGTNILHCRHLECAFTDVVGTNPDTWDTRQVVGGTSLHRGLRIVKAAWEPTGTGDTGAVTVSTTAVSGATPAYDTVQFDGDADMDGILHIWVRAA